MRGLRIVCPRTQVVVLYVEQEESVRRQMHRAMATNIHNQCAPGWFPRYAQLAGAHGEAHVPTALAPHGHTRHNVCMGALGGCCTGASADAAGLHLWSPTVELTRMQAGDASILPEGRRSGLGSFLEPAPWPWDRALPSWPCLTTYTLTRP